MGAPRRPLGAGVVTLMVIDAVLVVTLAFMLGQAGYLSGGAGGTGGATATASSTPTPTAEPVIFASPTRNISCSITPDAANCEIAQYMYATPTLAGCTGDVGHEIEVTPDGAHWVCRTGSPPPTPGPEVANLDWGDSITAYGYTCISERDGVTCTYDASGASFHLARREVTFA